MGVKNYVEVEARDEIGPRTYYRTVTHYYTLNGRLFAARLEFREGDKSEPNYRIVLDRVVRSIQGTGRIPRKN